MEPIGNVAFVTGGSKGMATAWPTLMRHGGDVVITARNEAARGGRGQ
jgi:NAD(P)-dependent dehydrogenase (short-subunit alcohol dehydrogenase family)